MSKNVTKFRKNKSYDEEYDYQMESYDSKKREKPRDSKKQAKYFESYEPDYYQDARRYRK